MTRVDTKLARKVGLALMAAVVVTLVVVPLAGAAVGSAQQSAPAAPYQPNPPHWFFGNVITDKGKTLPAGTEIKARTLPPSTWTGFVTTTVDYQSQYGYVPQFYVPGYSDVEPGAKPGDQIAFYVLGVQARLCDVGALPPGGACPSTYPLTTYPFAYWGHTNLDLQVAIKYTITATAGAHGSISPSGAVQVDYGFDQTFTITPDPNYLILDVLVDGVSNPGAVASGSYTFTNVTAPHTISATFVRATYLITPTAGTGCTITPGTQQVVPYKGSQTFTIAANTGYDLTDVKVDDVSQGPITTYTFSNVVADHTIAAACTLKTFVITPTAGPNGTITPGTPQTVNYGGSLTFTIAPNTGYKIVDVKVDGVSQGVITTYTFSNVTAPHTIEATFTILTYKITPTAGAGGTITPGTEQTVNYGGSLTFTIAPNPGYIVEDVKVDGVSQGAITTYTFTNVTANHTIAVTFKRVAFRLYLPFISR